jgi:hypothetical protein
MAKIGREKIKTEIASGGTLGLPPARAASQQSLRPAQRPRRPSVTGSDAIAEIHVMAEELEAARRLRGNGGPDNI